MLFTRKYKSLVKEIKNLVVEIRNIIIELSNFVHNNINKPITCVLTYGQYTDGNEDNFLKTNSIERMDANRVDLFDKSRCDFHLDRYRLACEYSEGKDVIDCASGTGYGADVLYKLGRANKVVGIEIDKNAVAYAQRHYSSDKVSFENGSILELPFQDNSFDVFTSFETIEHVENEERQLQEVKRVLKEGGYYIVSTPNDWSDIDRVVNPHHVRFYNIDSLVNSLSKHFEIVKIYRQNSGTNGRKENNNQPRGIYLYKKEEYNLAECWIVICRNIA